MRYYIVRLGLLMLVTLASVITFADTYQSVSLDDAVKIVEQASGGKVLKAHKVEVNDNVIYRVRVLTPTGKVRTMGVSAEDGRVLRKK